jgi:hypothetical protein
MSALPAGASPLYVAAIVIALAVIAAVAAQGSAVEAVEQVERRALRRNQEGRHR